MGSKTLWPLITMPPLVLTAMVLLLRMGVHLGRGGTLGGRYGTIPGCQVSELGRRRPQGGSTGSKTLWPLITMPPPVLTAMVLLLGLGVHLGPEGMLEWRYGTIPGCQVSELGRRRPQGGLMGLDIFWPLITMPPPVLTDMGLLLGLVAHLWPEGMLGVRYMAA
jgi:hypothetical protein